MMNRVFEGLAHACVFAPQSVAASTAKTTGYVDVSGAQEVEFLLSAAPLGAGKSLTVELLAAEDASGTGAVKVGESKFTDAVGTAPALAVLAYHPAASNGRYVAVKFQHDGAAAVVCGVIVSTKSGYLPAENSWTLAV